MNKTNLIKSCVAIAMAIGTQFAISAAPPLGAVEGVVRVKLQPEVARRINKSPMTINNGILRTGVEQFDRVSNKVKAVSMKRVFPYSPKFEEKHKQYGLDLWYEVEFDNTSVTPVQAQELYKTIPGIEIAEKVMPVKSIGGEKFRTISSTEIRQLSQRAAEMPFNDPLLPGQWHYNNDGSLVGTVAGADANVFKGWSVETGKKDVLVAIIDGGFDITHPDLAPNVWINELEANGKPGSDDDGNGYIDDVNGYNFVINSPDLGAHSHGTHVAGTVGAINNNNIGVAGVAGGSGNSDGVTMMACAVFDNRATLPGNNAAALVYAADMGASIAQCSWGWAEPDYYEQVVLDAVKYFTREGGGENMSGGLCIFATGNNGEEGNYYPACMEEAVAVTSMTATGIPAYYSNYGTYSDVAAPGGLLDDGQAYGVLSTLPNATYGYNEGTSMACPHVSGVAALILSKYGNPNFSNSTLRTQLTTSVNDLYANYPQGIGKYGSGYIDAYKALQIGSGKAPEAVDAITVTPSQDNILIEWIIPQAEEKTVDHHVIYYSTESFTANTDLSTLNSLTIDTKFKNSGDAMQYELGNLTPLTTYYIAMVAYNRWGDGSSLSPIVSATTNAGPVMTLDNTKLTLTVDAASSPVANGQFTINNTGAGMLKYNLSALTKKVSISTQSTDKANPGVIVPFNGSISSQKVARNQVVCPDYRKEDWPKKFTYSDGIDSYIGESDLTLPNALAQYFVVDPQLYPDGFNLTALNFGGYGGRDPEIEIYDGSRSISTASLITKVDYMFFAYGYNIDLSEQLYFAPGESFWVVAKFPAGQKNPLGAGLTKYENIKQYSFYSCDNGVTWTQLSEVLKGGNFEPVADQMTWDVRAISNNPDWSKVLNPNPIEGTVRPGESQIISLSNNGQKLVNGTYTFKVGINTNESPESKQSVEVKMNVKGYKAELVSAPLINFGDLLVGQSKTLTVEIVNNGYGAFAGKYGDFYAYDGEIACTSDQFEMPYSANGISARATSTIDITFKPTKAGNMSGTVTLTDQHGDKFSFTVRGVASEPAKVEVDNRSLDFGDLTVGGESKTAKFTVSNKGQYPLEYVFPKYSDKELTGAGNTHKFGYTYISNLGGSEDFAYDNNPELLSETDITSQFSDMVWQSEPINIGFKFPFYGKDYESIHVSSHGGLMFNTTDGNISCMIPTADCVDGLGYISAYANSGNLDFGSSSKVTYGRQDGKFIVKFTDVITPATEGGSAKTNISFHIVLCPDGSIEYHYDNYDPNLVFTGGSALFAGISDIDCNDVFVITDNEYVFDTGNEIYRQFATGTAIKIIAPAKSMIENISSTHGVIGIGESKEIEIKVKAGNDLYAGALENNLTLLTTDPITPGTNIVLKANIIGDLNPLASVDATSYDFGKVFRTSNARHIILLSNNGKKTLNVESITFNNGKFTVPEELKSPFAIQPGQGKDILITLPTEVEGAVSDVMTIKNDAGEPISINLSGTVIGTPVWAIDPTKIEVTTPYGVNVAQELKITNNGDETMEFGIIPETWFNIEDLTATEGESSVDYTFRAKSDGHDVAYEWIDITTDYDSHQPLAYYLDKTDFYTLELPFEFPFYGKMYKTMYVYNTGFVSFDKPDADYKQFPEPPAQIPTTDTFYKNIICPFWGNHTMGSPSTDGTYIKSYPDHVVVTWQNYGNSAMAGMDFQMLLYKNGTFKFQYRLSPEGILIGIYGLCGIMDETGTRGINPADQYIAPDNAMIFYPVKTNAVAPGNSVNVPVTLKADDLAGIYNRVMQFSTNVPGMEAFTLPVDMTITGEAVPVFPEVINIEQTIDPYYQPGVYDFTVENKGNRAFTITSIESELFIPDEMTWQQEAVLMVYAKSNGGFDPGPLSIASEDEQYSWIPVEQALPLEVGLTPIQFQLYLMNTYTVHAKDYTICFNTEGLSTPSVDVLAKVNVTDMPQMTFDREEIIVEANTSDFVGQESLVISNNGNYKLTYSLRLDPTGRDEVADEQGGGGIAPGVLAAEISSEKRAELFSTNPELMKAFSMPRMPEDENPYPYDYPYGEEFTNLIYYPMMKPWNSSKSAIMGTGSALKENFYAATRFVAPEEGFNLSKLYFVGTIGDLRNVDIEATVIHGSEVSSDKIITSGKIHIDKEEPAVDGGYYGVPRMITFDKSVYINPTDTFYVVMKYPAGYGHSAVLASRDGVKTPNRCMAFLSSLGGWVDLEEMLDAEYGYGPMGYFMTCVETAPGKPWIKLLTSETEGEIEVGQSKDVKFEIDADKAYFEKENRATLVIHSNDPMQKVVNYHITLNKNAAPAISAPEGMVTVQEGAQAQLPISVSDAEGDAFTAFVTDNDNIVSAMTFTNADGTTEGITEKEGVISVAEGKSLKIALTLAPDYGTNGIHYINVAAEDATGNASSADIAYNVEYSNRAPEYIGDAELAVTTGQNTGIILFSNLFTDPDNDEMVFAASMPSNKFASMMSNETGFILFGENEGTANIKLIATDNAGKETSLTVPVKVSDASGVENIETSDSEFTVFPNPVVDFTNVTLGESANDVNYSIYDNAGRMVFTHNEDSKAAGESQSIDMSNLASGVYYIVVTTDNGSHSTTVVKK